MSQYWMPFHLMMEELCDCRDYHVCYWHKQLKRGVDMRDLKVEMHEEIACRREYEEYQRYCEEPVPHEE
jgi:hypothetical protein